ncbi:MAG: hypothetical protein WAR37_01535 [Candidatus Microsaccharimonas sp.]
MTYLNEAPTIAVSQLRSFENNELFLKRHLPLERELAKQGARLIALNGSRDKLEGSAFSRFYTFNGDTLNANDSTTHVDAAYDLSGGIARYVPAVPALNPEKLRDTVLSKYSQHEALKPLGDHVPETVRVVPLKSSVEDAMEQMQSDRLIIKDDNGTNKKRRMLVGTKDEIRSGLDAYLETMDASKDVLVIQEYMPEVFSDFATGIIPVDETERGILNASRGLAREIRVHTIDGKPLHVTGRSGLDAQQLSPLDKWVYVHQDTVPKAVTDLASKAAQLTIDYSGARDAYLAVDITPDGNRIIEVNGRNIGTMSYDPLRPASYVAHKKTTSGLADKLVSMAYRSKKERS